MSLSRNIRKMVDKETEDYVEEIVGDIVAAIEAAIFTSTGKTLDEIVEEKGDIKIDTPLGRIRPESLDPLSLQAVLSRGHKTCIVEATNTNNIGSLDILIGRELAENDDVISAMTSLRGTKSASTLL